MQKNLNQILFHPVSSNSNNRWMWKLLTTVIHHLIGVTIVLNIATACPALVIIEVPVGVGDGGELLLVSAEPVSA